MNLSDVTIGITSFLRPGYLREAVNGVEKWFPECSLLVADDSGDYGDFFPDGHKILLPFDSGLSIKRNELVNNTKTKYFLLGCDDFVFDEKARWGVQELIWVLNRYPDVDVASGRVNEKSYEGFLEYVLGDYVKEIKFDEMVRWDSNIEWHKVDIAVNYFLARTDKILPWEESIKIGGEHVLWFLSMKQAGRKVVWVPGANINTQPYDASKQDPRYKAFRWRAKEGHKKMKEILKIKEYIDFNGAVS